MERLRKDHYTKKLAVRLRRKPQIGFYGGVPLWEFGRNVFVSYRRRDYTILTVLPIRGGSYRVIGC